MKKTILILLAFLAIGISNVEAQSQKKMRGKLVDAPGTKKIKKTESDKKHFRAVANALSTRESSAKSKALINAKRMISEQIKQSVKAASEMYTNENEVGDQAEFMQSMEQLTVISTKNILSGVATAGYELYYKKKDKKYNAYVMLEVAKDDIENALMDKISKDDNLKLKFNKEKFKKVFDAEMEKLEEAE